MPAQSKETENPARTFDRLPLAHSIDGVTKVANVGKTSIYAAIKAGELRARKNGRRTLILDDDLREWLRSLPILTAA